MSGGEANGAASNRRLTKNEKRRLKSKQHVQKENGSKPITEVVFELISFENHFQFLFR